MGPRSGRGRPPGEKDPVPTPDRSAQISSRSVKGGLCVRDAARGDCTASSSIRTPIRRVDDHEFVGGTSALGTVRHPGWHRPGAAQGKRASFLPLRFARRLFVVLTDENDCSLTAGGLSFPRPSTDVGTVPRRERALCARRSERPVLPLVRGSGADGLSGHRTRNANKGPYTSSEDSGLLRCLCAESSGFGRDYLYPVSRYVNGLTGQTGVPGRNGSLIDNPLFVDPTGQPRRPRESLSGLHGGG